MHTMKSKSFRGIAAVLAVALAGLLAWPAVTASQIRTGNGYYYFFQLTNEYDEPFTADGYANCSIYQYNDNGSIYSYTHSAASLALGTAQAGPLYSNTNGIIHWYSASTNPVDVVCFTKGGDSGRKVRMRINEHKLRIVTSGSQKVVRFPFVTNTAPTSTGIYIPQGAVVTSVALNVATAGASVAHIDVGFGGNHAFGLRNALADRLQVGPTTTAAAVGFNTFMDPTGAVGATWPGIGGVQSIPRTHMGVLLKHFNGALVSGTYNGGAMVHVTGGLELTYDTSNVAVIGGHVYVFFTVLHTGSTVHGPGY
jgi:hypothetical protein